MRITIHNLHIDLFAGKVPRSTYNYFAKKSKITLTQYIPIGYWGDIDEMPLKYQFFRDGNLVKNCLLWWHHGVILDSATTLIITQDDKEVYQANLMNIQNQFNEEIKFKANTIRLEDSDIVSNQAVFVCSEISAYWSQEYQKGRRFFEGEIKNATVFEPKKLKVFYKDVVGTRILDKVTYDGIKIKPSKEVGSSEIEFQKAWWYLPNGEIPYDFEQRFGYEKYLRGEWLRQHESLRDKRKQATNIYFTNFTEAKP